ncbi:hypothetical protein [Thermoflavimicrobium dichotomicum]|uniref:PrgI family protein n=1 Tax=Thermoflavimicrobium dichotomicum TaxID=46223 RepID=A0A1I3K777_9BACL|nr:hypothetical protein [Thermoflavimicrobium dichotomicum]SFI68170.1 hypothetical protein SAMN05421852_101355 [Thermoflavimicrobium dichotomicum]
MSGIGKKKFKIPNHIDKSFHIWRFITLRDVLILLPLALLGFILYQYILPDLGMQIKLTLSLIPLMFGSTAIFVRPIKERSNIMLYDQLKWRYQFNQRQREFLLKKKHILDGEGMVQRKNKPPEKAAQDLIPVRNIYDEMIETSDQRLIKILSVSSVNLSLMSYQEEREVLEGYEVFLKSLKQPIQITRVAEPINLKGYIVYLKKLLNKTENPYRRRMLESYIDYTQRLQEDRQMIRRQCYVIIDEAFSDERSKQKAIKKLKERVTDLKLRLEEMLFNHKLEVHELTNEELKRYLYQMFDYENAYLHMMDDMSSLPYIIGKRNLLEAAERLKQKEEYLL